MKQHYSSMMKGQTLLKAAAVVAVVMVWILIDKGNALGQESNAGSHAVKHSQHTAAGATPLLRDGSRDGGIGEDGEDGSGDFSVFPNPVKDDAVFDFGFTVRGEMPYQITDALGRLIDQGTFVPDLKRQTVDFSRYRTGMYLVRVQMGNKAVVKRIIKQ
jgi:hypothetical protein